MADDQATENAKKVLAEQRQASEKTKQDFAERSKGKPTPTQEENDLAALGAHFHEHEADGSDPDPNVSANKNVEANKPQGYATRQVQPAAQHRARSE
jgi:hypothetical protein